MNIDITLLKPHPRNTKIYGEENIQDLADKIKESNWIKPLVINQDNVVLSGHRRLKVCKMLGIEDVPCERINFENENQELERLLLENESRIKTNEQKTREMEIWEEVIKEKAKLRQGRRTDLETNIVGNFPQSDTRKTRDIVAEKVGLGSGRTGADAKKVVKEIDKLEEEGNVKDAEFLKTTLNESVSGAKNLLDTDLTKIDEDIKHRVINKEMTAKEAIKEIKKEIVAEPNNSDVPKTQEERETNIVENFPQSEIQTPVTNEVIEEINIISKNTNLDFEVDKDNFIKAMSKYTDMEEQLSELGKVDKAKIRECIEEVKNIFNKIEDMLW